MKTKNKQIYEILLKIFPNPKSELEFNSPFELLVSVILSSQCTDKRVNAVTKELFKKYNTPKDFANVELYELENLIRPCGFYHNKAQNIIKTSKDLVEKFNGKVPNNREDLMGLAGVGRKTANVVLSVAFNENAIAVDTHVFRVAHRLGLSNGKTPEDVEKDLMKEFDENLWGTLHHLLVLFGRYICKSLNPDCLNCKLYDFCKYEFKKKK